MMRKLAKEALHKIRFLWKKLVRYLILDYRLTFWLNLNRWRKFAAFFSKHFGFIRRALFIVAALGFGYAVNRFGGSNFTSDILSNYLVAVGAMTGGTIAIVFTISIFLLQSVSDLYSSQYFEVYIHDWKEKFVYFVVILITIVLLGGGLYVGSLAIIPIKIGQYVVSLSLFFIGVVFALIDWQYKNVRQKINPSEAISFLESEGYRFLKKLQYDAEKMAGILQAKDGSVAIEMALATSYNAFLQPFIGNLNRQLENLLEISMKLSDKQEIETTKRGFTAIRNILIKFFEARKNSSMVLPSMAAFLAMESDSQAFLTSNFERLNNAAEKFIKDGKDGNAVYIIDVYHSLAKKAKEIEYIGGRGIENPILDHIAGYLNSLIESGQRSKNLETVFQGSRVLGNIGTIAADKGLQITVRSIQDNLMKISVYGLTEKQFIIVDNCISAYLQIIGSIFSSGKSVRYQADFSLKKIAEISVYIWTLVKSRYVADDFTSRISLGKGYDEMFSLIAGIVNHYFKLTDAQEKSRYRKDVVELFKNINLSLRKLSEEIKNADSLLTDSVGRLIFNINNLIVDLLTREDLKVEFSEEDELFDRLTWNIHLPFWFAHHAEKFDGGSNPFDTLTDSVAKTGIIAIEKLEDEEVAIECVKSIYSMTKECLEKNEDTYGLDEPRVLEKACYLGILALKKGWDNLFIEVAFNIYDFEPKFFAKFLTNLPPNIDPENHNVMGLPHKDQLLRELMRWRDDFYREKWNGVHMMGRAEDMMYPLIERIDIDRFIYEVWGRFPSGSEIEDEIKLKLARKRLVSAIRKRLP